MEPEGDPRVDEHDPEAALPRPLLAIAGAIALAALAIYGRAVRVGFYSDDLTWLGRMAATRLHPAYLFSVFYRDFNPLLHASFLLDDLIGRGSAGPFHATSLLVHAGCAFLLALLCFRLHPSLPLAGAAALTWAFNVRLSEAVIWPAARGHSLATLLVLAALLALTGRGRWRTGQATALFALALLAKETSVVPMVLAPLFLAPPWPAPGVAAGAWPPVGGRALWQEVWRRARRLLPLYLLAAAFLLFNQLVKPSFHYADSGAATLLLKLPFVLLRPLGLGDLYDFSWIGLSIVLAAFAVAAVLLRRTVALTGFLWLALSALPIVPLEKLSSRYLSMMAIGYAFILCGAASRIGALIGSAGGRRAAVALGVMALLLVGSTNVILIQREIGDYALLGGPYAACLEALRLPAAALQPGETLVLVDRSPRDTVDRLTELAAERGGITKLIPYRAAAVDGLVSLSDAVNIVRRGREGLLGAAVSGAAAEGPAAAPRRVYVYDGLRVQEVATPPSVPPGRLLQVRLGSFADYRTAEIEADR
ncbi:MAG TPA: hypothetical protein VFT43_13590 [Candidatus Polarisedimenticolia bacterium]|nr:hypothetical protein [Candidatus Polarisedimenticolia bacterium]